MSYKISGATALSLATTLTTTGCLGDPMVGDWSMSALSDECKNQEGDGYTLETCIALDVFSFTAESAESGISASASDVKGSFVQNVTYDGGSLSYAYNFEATGTIVLAGNEEGTEYDISVPLQVTVDGGEGVIENVGLELSCTLNDASQLDCSFDDFTIEDESYAEIFSAWKVVFEQ